MHTSKPGLFVIAAPSGAGKTTLVQAITRNNPDLRFSISYTTRKQRRNEAHGRDYLFVDVDEFERLRAAGEMLESATVFDNLYGTSREQVEHHLAEWRSPRIMRRRSHVAKWLEVAGAKDDHGRRHRSRLGQ